MVNGLTRRQASVVAEAKKEGKITCFRKGKLRVGSKRPDPRTYADVAAAAETEDRTQDNDRVNNEDRGQGQYEPVGRSTVPLSDSSTDRRASNTQYARANRSDAPSVSQKRGGGRQSPESPVNKFPNRNFPQHSKRNRR